MWTKQRLDAAGMQARRSGAIFTKFGRAPAITAALVTVVPPPFPRGQPDEREVANEIATPHSTRLLGETPSPLEPGPLDDPRGARPVTSGDHIERAADSHHERNASVVKWSKSQNSFLGLGMARNR